MKSVIAIVFYVSLFFLYTTRTLAEVIPEFDIHFVVITNSQEGQKVANLTQLIKEVDILNKYFVSEDRHAVVKFNFKSAKMYAEVINSACEIVHLGSQPKKYDAKLWSRLFNECDDQRVRDSRAINFYVFDSYSNKYGFSDKNSHGVRNSNKPYILMDWERLNHRVQSPEEHEMGHVFGLQHECVQSAGRNDHTNIMASADCKKGSGGRRDIGFNAKQIDIIRNYTHQIRLNLAK